MARTVLPWLMVTDVASAQTYVIEPTRRGSAKLRASRMGATDRSADSPVRWREVPLYIRRSAREALSPKR
jgi:hypothetical protein